MTTADIGLLIEGVFFLIWSAFCIIFIPTPAAPNPRPAIPTSAATAGRAIGDAIPAEPISQYQQPPAIVPPVPIAATPRAT